MVGHLKQKLAAHFCISLATDDLDKKFKDFTKVTNKIKKKFDSLPPGNSPESIIIDAAIQEMDKVMEFFGESFKNNDIE